MHTNEHLTNIAAVLKGCKTGEELYSPACGMCLLFAEVTGDSKRIQTYDSTGRVWEFDSFGRLSSEGECMLFPAEMLCDWGCFKTFFVRMRDGMSLGEMSAAEDTLRAKGAKGKERSLPAFDNNIWYIDRISGKINSTYEISVPGRYIVSTGTELRIGQREQKPPQPEFEPFDRVIVRQPGGRWVADIFSHYGKDAPGQPYVTAVDSYAECLPFNDVSAKLIGTAKNPIRF